MLFSSVLSILSLILTLHLDFTHCTRTVTDRCTDTCQLQTSHTGSSADLRPRCHGDCLTQCTVGCEIWRSSLQSSCLEACTESERYSSQVAQCVTGCNEALDIYADDIDVLLSNVSSPVLVAGSKTSDTVILEWRRPLLPGNASYVLQKLYVNLSEEWEEHTNLTWGGRQITVDDLHPYVTYKFRVVILVSPQHPVISPESVPIPTLASGVPSGVPIIQTLSTSSTSVHLKWSAPYFVNAPLLGYKLSISQADGGGDGEERIKDISVQSRDAVSEVITLLRPDTSYVVRVAARNRYGLGPRVEKVALTQSRSKAEGMTPYLIICSDNRIHKQYLEDLFTSKMLYELEDPAKLVTGLAIHYTRDQLYFTDSAGSVRMFHMEDCPDSDLVSPWTNPVTRPVYTSSHGARAMSVDWLHHQLYIAEDNQIIRCDIEGEVSSCRPVITDLDSRPPDIQVDPCNGYLFWAQSGHTAGGLYRLDLADLSQSALSSPVSARIVADKQLTAFILDYNNFRILFANETRNSLMKVDLDGTDLQDLRQDMQHLQFINVRSMTQYSSVCYFTNGEKVFIEEKDPNKPPNSPTYIHNMIFINGAVFSALKIWHPTAQPLPVPLMPPQNLQLLFSEDSVILSCDEPEMDQGRGAWHGWQYEIQEVTGRLPANDTYRPLGPRRWAARGLRADTLYSFRVRALSAGGHGPWSVVVNGTTLHNDDLDPYLLYVNGQNVCQINLDGTEQSTRFDLSSFRETVVEVETYGAMHLFTLSNGSVVLQEGDGPMSVVPGVYGASVLAYDWVADTLYWSSPRHNMIQRVRLSSPSPGRLPESIHQGSTSVLDIVLDSERGYIYWTTSYTIEMARLSGRGHRMIQNVRRFSGRYILGLAVDLGGGALYWVMKEDDELTFFRVELVTAGVNDQQSFSMSMESTYTNRASFPTLQYYSNKLLWASDGQRISVQDLRGRSLAAISVPLSVREVTAFTVVHQGKGHRQASVGDHPARIPSAVRLSTVKVASSSVSVPGGPFYVSWAPVTTPDGFPVYYNLLVECEGCPDSKSISKNNLEQAYCSLNNIGQKKISPYSNLTITVEACTHWGCNDTQPNKVTRRSPEAAPTVPLRPRKFVTFHRRQLSRDVSIEVEFRWSRPGKMNGALTQYVVQTRVGVEPWVTLNRRGRARKRYEIIYNAEPSTGYYFRVCACTKPGCGPYTDIVHVNTSDEAPEPMLLAVDSQMLRLVLLDDGNYSANITTGSVRSVAFIAQDDSFYWIDGHGAIRTLRGENDTSQERVIVAADGTAKSLAMDWVARNLYWLEGKPREENRIMKYSLGRGAGRGAGRGGSSNAVARGAGSHSVLLRHATLWQIAVDPLHSTMFWTETRNSSGGYLMRCRLDGSDIHSVIYSGNATTATTRYKYRNEARLSGRRGGGRRPRDAHPAPRASRDPRAARCDCPALSVGPVFVVDHHGGEVYIVDDATGSVWATDGQGCLCRLVVDAEGDTRPQDLGLPPDSLTVDLERLYWTHKPSATVNSVLKRDGTDFVRDTDRDAPTRITAYGKHLQPMPDPDCLLAGNYSARPRPVVVTNTSATFALAPWAYGGVACAGVSVPAVTYTLMYRAMGAADDYRECGSNASCLVQAVFDPHVTLSDLTPDTSYQIQVKVANLYSREPNAPSRYESFRTRKGIPSPPRSVRLEVVTFSTLRVLWLVPARLNGPLSDVNYAVDWFSIADNGTRTEGLQNVNSLPQTEHGYYWSTLENLQPNQTYTAKVRAYNGDRTGFTASPLVANTTYQLPAVPTTEAINATAIRVMWELPADGSITRHQYEGATYRDPETFTLHPLPYITNYTGAPRHTHTFSGLRPDSTYYFRMQLVNLQKHLVYWPPQPVACTTPVGPPSRPDPPKTSTTVGAEMVVEWQPPYDGGEPITAYLLEYLDRESHNWTLVYNASVPAWVVAGLPQTQDYVFRVAAVNAAGQGEYSVNESLHFQPYNPGVHVSDRLTIILGSVLSVILVVIIIGVIMVLTRWRHHKDTKMIPFTIVPGQRTSPDMELATLRELPRVTVQTNALYAIKPSDARRVEYILRQCSSDGNHGIIPTDEDIAALPHFRRDQLTLTKFLGSGAFGEVFEGLARNILSANSGETRVAVKTLRKGATDQEKEEFLKEALLMSNFKYELILRLLGVCLDNDPQFIILELMEGGDLLSYLRSSRPTPTSPAKLSLPEMVGICVDVSMGCRHLEDMHFVHRDLAARNCLVSSRKPEVRVVKIGDFGLARDIYKNDYYRKEGEGLLPVRWMSPESLVDGVFTTQSDVWAFGVLMWEVLTLGQQPYPARTNLEVLHFVRSGGRLDRPDNCPDDLYTLMLECWSYNPEGRPSFSYILERLEGFKQRSLDPTSDFSARNGAVALSPLACTSRLYDDDTRLLNQASANGQMSQDQSGINGVVKLPPLDKERSKTLSPGQPLSGSTASVDKSRDAQLVPEKSSLSSSSSLPKLRPISDSGSNNNNNSVIADDHDDDHGYLAPLSARQPSSRPLSSLAAADARHKYLELVGGCVDAGRGGHHDDHEGLGPAPPLPSDHPETKDGHRNGYRVAAGRDPRSGRRVYYTALASGGVDPEDGEIKTVAVRLPYRGPHTAARLAPAASNLPAVRDIAGRSVPPPPASTPSTGAL